MATTTNMSRLLTRTAFGLALATAAFAAQAENRTLTGAVLVEPPTLINLGFEWQIEGDDNRNARVAVDYRAVSRETGGKELPWQRDGSLACRREVWLAAARLHRPKMFAAACSISTRTPNTRCASPLQTLTASMQTSASPRRGCTLSTRAPAPSRARLSAARSITCIHPPSRAPASNPPTAVCWRRTTWHLSGACSRAHRPGSGGDITVQTDVPQQH